MLVLYSPDQNTLFFSISLHFTSTTTVVKKTGVGEVETRTEKPLKHPGTRPWGLKEKKHTRKIEYRPDSGQIPLGVSKSQVRLKPCLISFVNWMREREQFIWYRLLVQCQVCPIKVTVSSDAKWSTETRLSRSGSSTHTILPKHPCPNV